VVQLDARHLGTSHQYLAGRLVHERPVEHGTSPCGYDTEVGERGALLAAVERQLVAFARTWIADPTLLVLDEATSNLDVVTEARVQWALRRLRQGRTTIVIAHRLTTVAEADQVAVVEDGLVVEAGPPEELVDRGAASPTCTAAG
jgi:ABC-type multidrug transport system fused ATPase/permease subunit